MAGPTETRGKLLVAVAWARLAVSGVCHGPLCPFRYQHWTVGPLGSLCRTSLRRFGSRGWCRDPYEYSPCKGLHLPPSYSSGSAPIHQSLQREKDEVFHTQTLHRCESVGAVSKQLALHSYVLTSERADPDLNPSQWGQ